jgi:hypothetical protein
MNYTKLKQQPRQGGNLEINLNQAASQQLQLEMQ